MCKCNQNGGTYLKEILPVAVGATTATSQQYYLDFVHKLCNGRKICVNGSYPLTSNISFSVGDIYPIGLNTYSVDIIYTGSVTYMPYTKGQNNCCEPCPKTDAIFGQFTVPVYKTTAGAPTITLTSKTGSLVTSPANVEDCCNVTQFVEIEAPLLVVSGTTSTAS